jgi:hypothetical protein
MLLASPPYYTHSFGALRNTLEAAQQSEFFRWFQLEEAERHAEGALEAVRFRPTGEKFHELCYLDVLATARGNMAALELTLQRAFLDGRDALFAQDLVKSFLFGALPDACRENLRDFLEEMNVPGGEGETAGYEVFRGRKNEWRTETGWSRLAMANLSPEGIPSLAVELSANPDAPNASPMGSE